MLGFHPITSCLKVGHISMSDVLLVTPLNTVSVERVQISFGSRLGNIFSRHAITCTAGVTMYLRA